MRSISILIAANYIFWSGLVATEGFNFQLPSVSLSKDEELHHRDKTDPASFTTKCSGNKSVELGWITRTGNKGVKYKNEDFVFSAQKGFYTLLGVLDGHGDPRLNLGRQFSRLSANFMTLYFDGYIGYFTNAKQFLVWMFTAVGKAVHYKVPAQMWEESGTTATVALIRHQQNGDRIAIWVSNLGDSRAAVTSISDANLLSRKSYTTSNAYIVTEEQNISEPAQRLWAKSKLQDKKISDLLGSKRYFCEGSYLYVSRNSKQTSGLQLTGSLGDGAFEPLKRSTVSMEDVAQMHLIRKSGENVLLIMASDGLWTPIDYESGGKINSAKIVSNLIAAKYNPIDPKWLSGGLHHLLQQFPLYFSPPSDDTTALTIFFKGFAVDSVSKNIVEWSKL